MVLVVFFVELCSHDYHIHMAVLYIATVAIQSKFIVELKEVNHFICWVESLEQSNPTAFCALHFWEGIVAGWLLQLSKHSRIEMTSRVLLFFWESCIDLFMFLLERRQIGVDIVTISFQGNILELLLVDGTLSQAFWSSIGREKSLISNRNICSS